MKQLLQKIKEFFNEPDQMDVFEELFLQKLNDMRKHPEKYQHLSKKSGWSKIPPVSLF